VDRQSRSDGEATPSVRQPKEYALTHPIWNSARSLRPRLRAFVVCILLVGAVPTFAAEDTATTLQDAPHETPADLVAGLHTAFGVHHARAVHAKGTILQGTFTPAPEARD
jgi:hypothetical protein